MALNYKERFLLCRPVQVCCLPFFLCIASQQVSGQPHGVEWEVLDQYCLDCHNLEDYAGGTAFDLLPRDELSLDAATWELTIRKIKTGMMPPSGEPRPTNAVLDELTQGIAGQLDHEYGKAPDPGNEGVGRLNREEYKNAVRDLLAFDAAHIADDLPGESQGEGFDNNIEVLSVSPTLIDAYASTAMRISREAVGDRTLFPTEIEYLVGSGQQDSHKEGLPLGTRGGMRVKHNFPLDAQYEITVNRAGRGFFSNRAYCSGGNEIVLSIDGEFVAIENSGSVQLPISAGPHTIAVALQDARRCTGVNDFYDDYDLSGAIAGIEIAGPFEASGPGDTPSRNAIFSCYPEEVPEELTCAREILSHLATRAYRRPVGEEDAEVSELLDFFRQGRALDGFEVGIQYAIARLLIDPRFLYQLEEQPETLAPGELYAISDLELASRLSFFLWSSIPDEELLAVAANGRLHEPEILEQQVRRMLQDPKIEALVDNFAGQWLQLRELDAAQPQDPAFNSQLRGSFVRETELVFSDLVRLDEGLLTLMDTDYTWLNEQLAGHYGIDGVRGDYMRRVSLPEDSPRRGLLGKGSILTATSVANRTSPVVRGTWIVENLLGAPVPLPPPDVETDLSENSDSEDVSINTLRDRLEMHRDNPACASCHQIMDPIGLALENFDLVGRWRTEESNGSPLNTHTELVDGTPISGPATLRRALLERGDTVATTMVEKLLSYALGRHLHSSDMAAVRVIIDNTADSDYRFSEVVLGIVDSLPFRMKVAEDIESTVAER